MCSVGYENPHARTMRVIQAVGSALLCSLVAALSTDERGLGGVGYGAPESAAGGVC